MSNVILENLVKSYDGKKNIIDGINLEIKDCEFIVLVGSSGCGKSTILRLISGLEEITSGTIKIDNKIVNGIHPKDRDIAFVFQSYALYPHMSVYDNIAFGLKMRKFDKKTIHEKVLSTAKALNLEEYLDRKPRELSGGQRQRVALGRAIVRNPKVFLMDEPLSNLDANLRIHMRTEIKRLHNELKTTFIYVTHDQTEAMTMGDRIVVLDKGKIQQADTPEVIYNNPKNAFVGGFIGQMNFIDTPIVDGNLIFNDIRIPLNDDLKALLSDYKEILVGIRPDKMLSGTVEIPVCIDITEMNGSSKNLYFKINDCACSAGVPFEFKAESGVLIKPNLNDFHFFDKKTQESILYNRKKMNEKI